VWKRRAAAETPDDQEEGFCMTKFTWLTYSLMAFGLAIGVATVSFADHSWGGYHWARTSNPFTLKVGDNVSSAWDTYLNERLRIGASATFWTSRK
jgi:hypothetical protein